MAHMPVIHRTYSKAQLRQIHSGRSDARPRLTTAGQGTIGVPHYQPVDGTDANDGPSPPESRFLWGDPMDSSWPGSILTFWSQGIITALPSYAEGNPGGVPGVAAMVQDPALSVKINAWLTDTYHQPLHFARALDAYPLYTCVPSPIANSLRYIRLSASQGTCWFGRAARMYLDSRRRKLVTSIRPTPTIRRATRTFALAGPPSAGNVGLNEEDKIDWLMWGGVGLLTAAAGIFGMTYWREQQMKSNPRGGALVSSTQTGAAERKIRSAAAAKFGRGKADLFFEHGQWWARMDDGDRDQDYSVVDAVPGFAGTGIDFEPI